VSLGSTPIGRLQIGEVNTGRTYDVLFDDVVFDPSPLAGALADVAVLPAGAR
jgi:hypothetical protein